HVNFGMMIGVLFCAQLLPLGAGLAVRQWRPAIADRLQKPFNRSSAILNVITFGVIVWTQFGTLVQIRFVAYVGMLALVLASVMVGWLSGAPGAENRVTMA